MNKRLPFLLFFLMASLFLCAQSAQDATIPLSASVDTTELSITLNWPNPAASTITLKRRKKGLAGNQWTQLFTQASSTVTTFTDTGLEKGSTYEYSIRRTTTFNAFGYAHVAVLEPLTDYRGKILIFIDSTTADATGVEFKLFKDGLRGDGWQTIPIKTGPSSTVQSIKGRIVEEYNADPANVKAVLLIGEIPVPYSGNSAWDGHSDHAGAWPSDNYYADVNGNWTDVTVNNVSPSRPANDNVPGDGKFDQSSIPSPVELMIGRIDFRRLNPATFGATPTELIQRYFIKNHKWRTKQYTARHKALVDDNFGYFGGEAFAANGYRNAYPLVGAENVQAGDFLTATDTATFLMGYGCGGGSYTSASGVGNSTQIAGDSINIVFSNIFGSYHGDWDFENNPLMPSALASKGGILTISWAGRPSWFLQALASGETMGYCTKETMNAQYNNEYFISGTFGTGGAHVALLGDPTVRAHIIAPVPEVSGVSTCSVVGLSWQPAPDTGILGYHVYRSFHIDGPYARLTDALVEGLEWTDSAPVQDTLYYQVRPVRIDHAPGGGLFYNAGTGFILQFVQEIGNPVLSHTVSNMLDCNHLKATLAAQVEAPFEGTIYWSGPGFSATGDSVTISEAGMYTVSAVSEAGCFTTDTILVTSDFSLPEIALQSITHVTVFGAADGAIDIETTEDYDYQWSTGETTQDISGLSAGTYQLTITNPSNSCEQVFDFTISQPVSAGEPENGIVWSLSPNPAGSQTLLRVETTDKQVLQIDLFGPDGRLLECIRPSQGVQTVLLDVRSRPPGMYQVSVLTDRGRAVRLLAVNR